MASLLQRARQIQDRLKEKTAIEAIPPEEREKIYNEIDQAVSSNKLRIEKNTFSFTPVSSDIKLLVLINLGAFILIVGLSITFYFMFNQAETSIVSEKENVVSAESRLLQALKEESEQQLGEKERQIQNIQGRLENMRLEQEKLISDSQEQADKLEAELRQSFEEELENERRKLQNEGLSSESIDQKLKEFELAKQAEYQKQIDLMKEELEEERLAKEKALNDLITGYEQNLESARTDRIAMEEELKRQYAEKEQEYAAREQESAEREQVYESERDKAVAMLAGFDQLQKKEGLVIDQIFSMYSNINDSIKNSQYESAEKNLDNLENFLNQDNVAGLPAILYRRETDIFMIQSLQKLIEIEKSQNELDTDSLLASANILSTVSGIVEEGNRLYDQGNLEAARESYLMAISRVPVLDTGFTKLKSIEEQALEQERLLEANRRESFEKKLEEERLAKERALNNLIAEYEQTLEKARTNRLVMEEALKQQYSERGQSDLDTDSLIESANILAAVSGIVEEGNRLYDQGNMEAARESYLTAISQVPSLDTGFTKLQNIEKHTMEEALSNLSAGYEQNLEKALSEYLTQKEALKQQYDEKELLLQSERNTAEAKLSGFSELKEQERELFIRSLSEGDRYFRSKDFESAIKKYRQALEFLENDSDVVDRIVTQLVDAGLGIETARGNTLISSGELARLNEAKIRQQSRTDLLNELSLIEKKYDFSDGPETDSGDYTEKLVFLLNTKILIKEVLASDSIREEYPDLHEKMELYMDAYGKEKEKEGRDAALEEIVAITEYLSKEGVSDISITTPKEERQRELFLQFLQNLKGLFELGG